MPGVEQYSQDRIAKKNPTISNWVMFLSVGEVESSCNFSSTSVWMAC
jgi:hypothetical protein